MAEPNDGSSAGSGEQPDDDKQDVIRRAREKFQQLKNAPRAPSGLRDRILSELGVDDSAGAESPGAKSPGAKSPSAGKDE